MNQIHQPRNPLLTVDIIIEMEQSVILIKRRNDPVGWALPGGFVDYGESIEDAAIREAAEETSLKIELLEQFHTYSAPARDPRRHTVSTVFIASANGIPKAADDAKALGLFRENELPSPMVFDHNDILHDYFRYRNGERLIDIFRF